MLCSVRLSDDALIELRSVRNLFFTVALLLPGGLRAPQPHSPTAPQTRFSNRTRRLLRYNAGGILFETVVIVINFVVLSLFENVVRQSSSEGSWRIYLAYTVEIW